MGSGSRFGEVRLEAGVPQRCVHRRRLLSTATAAAPLQRPTKRTGAATSFLAVDLTNGTGGAFTQEISGSDFVEAVKGIVRDACGVRNDCISNGTSDVCQPTGNDCNDDGRLESCGRHHLRPACVQPRAPDDLHSPCRGEPAGEGIDHRPGAVKTRAGQVRLTCEPESFRRSGHRFDRLLRAPPRQRDHPGVYARGGSRRSTAQPASWAPAGRR